MAKENKSIFGENPTLSFFLGLFVGLASFSTIAAIILVLAMYSGNPLSFAKNDAAGDAVAAGAQEAVAAEEDVGVAEVPAVGETDYAVGPEDASITLIEYSDFECPYCLSYKTTMDQVLKDYDGKIRFVFRHFPLSFHENARGAAMAAECAGEQGKFWEMYEKIFDANADGTMGTDVWKQAAKEIGLNTGDFNVCLDENRYDSKINEEMQTGAQAGVRGTPATFINGQMVSGALPIADLEAILDQILAQ
ncbi:MAG: thioredoxin domain-containing protein [Patescibacteria group bacterium]|nr:thioredoxin domain-containing protein [Patescibacteria group bacterium]